MKAMASLEMIDNVIPSVDNRDFLVRGIECKQLSAEKGEMELRIRWNNKISGVFLYVLPGNTTVTADTIMSLPYAVEIVQSEYQREGKYTFTVKEIGAVTILALPWFRDDKKKRVALQIQDGENILRGVIGRKAKVVWKTIEESNLAYRLRNKERKVRIIIETSDPIPKGVFAFKYSDGTYEIDEEIEYRWDKTIIEPPKSKVLVCFASMSAAENARIFQLMREDR
jgi:hypothetical protein